MRRFLMASQVFAIVVYGGIAIGAGLESSKTSHAISVISFGLMLFSMFSFRSLRREVD